MGVGTFSNSSVVIVGDLMLDEFLRGDVMRISPEAPVPILDMKDRASLPGGAANAANNVRSLGARAALVGVVGADDAATTLRELLRGEGIETAGVVTDATRPTTQKTRVVARGQQVVRIDRESREPLSSAVTQALVKAAREAIATASACIVSDYGKGVVTEELVAAVVDAARARKIPVVVDPKRKDFSVYRGATVVTPNLNELELASGRHAETTEAVIASGTALLPALGGASLLVTRGAAGMTLLEPGKPAVHTHARARAVFDVTGAGDTVVGTLALALAVGTPLAEAIEIASVAAGLVVSKVGTATVTREELDAELARSQP